MNLSRKSLASVLLVSSAVFSSVFTSGCYVRASFQGKPGDGYVAPVSPDSPASPPNPTPPSVPDSPEQAPAIRYDHFVDGHFNGHVDFQPERAGAERGTMTNDSNMMRGTWVLEGKHLVMRWPSAQAPGGAWIDDVVFSADMSIYEGRNNVGSAIIGQRSTDPIVHPTEVPHVVGEATLPEATRSSPVEHRPDGTCWQSPFILAGGPVRPMLLPAIQVRCG